MSLKTRVDNERTSSWVHCANKLSVEDLKKLKLSLIIPMLIISVLTEKSNSTLSIKLISCRHVQVINEVNKSVFTNWTISSTGLLLKIGVEYKLEKVGISVEVHVDDLLHVIISLRDKLVQ
jgi:hypothetical protein